MFLLGVHLAPEFRRDPSHNVRSCNSLHRTRGKQGKVAELKLELSSGGGKKDKNFMSKKIALKKVVANMTMSNNDMVALFADIVACMGIPSLEIKKMYVNWTRITWESLHKC